MSRLMNNNNTKDEGGEVQVQVTPLRTHSRTPQRKRGGARCWRICIPGQSGGF